MPVVRDYTALLSGRSLSGEEVRKTPAVITYSFDTKAQPYLDDYDFSSQAIGSWKPFSNTEQQTAIEAMRQISAVSGVKFIEVAAGTGDIRFGKLNFNYTDEANAAAFAYYPSRVLTKTFTYDAPIASDVFVNTSQTAGLHLLLHEIGHAIGLKHPFDGSNNRPTLADDLDDTSHTVMSYTGSWGSKLGHLDVDALRHIYGGSKSPEGTLESYSYKSGVVSQTWGSDSNYIAGTAKKDSIKAGGGNDIVSGFDGNDRLAGGSGNDKLFGGAGDDTLDPGSGNDFIFGGSQEWEVNQGTDTIDYGTSTKSVRVRLEGEEVSGKIVHATGSSIGTDRIYSVENVRGGSGADNIAGDAAKNVLYGNDGEDKLYGRDGADTLYGGSQRDSLYGEAGNDKLYGEGSGDVLNGGDGNDRLDGGTGSDKLTGGAGEDLFVYAVNYAKDKVLDFVDDMDTLRLNDNLWSGAKSVSEVIKSFADLVDGDAVFDFGDGDILTIADVDSLSSLKNDILIV